MNVFKNISLKNYNTFDVDVYAKYFAAFHSVNELVDLLDAFPHEQILVIGGGSNILLTQNFEGIVLKNEIKGIENIKEDENHFYVKANSGEIWHDFILYCIKNNFAGVENLSLIPGCVGASPMQNIGAYGVEIKDVFVELQAMHIKEKSIRQFSHIDCAFGYRDSVFKNKLKGQYIILNVTYRLNKKAEINTTYGAINQELERMQIKNPTIKDVSDAVINIRRSKLPDPKVIGNAGSFFKNPVIAVGDFKKIQIQHPEIPFYHTGNEDCIKVPAGWLIEKAGWKGFREKDYGVHNRQALVLVNYGNAKGQEIFDLSQKIIDDIELKYGIHLEREVNII